MKNHYMQAHIEAHLFAMSFLPRTQARDIWVDIAWAALHLAMVDV